MGTSGCCSTTSSTSASSTCSSAPSASTPSPNRAGGGCATGSEIASAGTTSPKRSTREHRGTDRLRFEGRKVIVTGGGRGIGEATARRFAAEGADVLLISRTEEDVAAVAESIRDGGGMAWHQAGDVGSAADVDRIVAAAEESWGGPIHGLARKAGVT